MVLRKSRQLTEIAPSRCYPEKTLYLSAAEAQPLVAKYVQRSAVHAHYHPDSILEPDGVKYAPKSGKNGGIVLYYLKRVEAGLRGEYLAAETREELQVKFGDEQVGDFASEGSNAKVGKYQTADVGESDDTRLDEAIAGKSRSVQKALKRKRGADGANMPPSLLWEDSQPKEEFEHEQQELVGEVGDREGAPEGAPVSQQNGQRPAIVKHDSRGNVKIPQGNNGTMSRTERKAAKKLRMKEEKSTREVARKAGVGKNADDETADAGSPADAPEPAIKKRRVKQEDEEVNGTAGPVLDEAAAKAAKKLKKQQKKQRQKEGKIKTEDAES